MGVKLELQDILQKFKNCEEFYSEDFKRGEEDIDFTIGENNAQWPEYARKARNKRPMLQENRLLPFVNQVINQIRQARPTVIVKPVDDKADVKTAEILRGLIKNIEMTSNADVVYDTAARNSVMGSVGWIRVGTDYAGYDTFDQEITIERIQSIRGAMLDPSHQKLDGSDAEYGFVYDEISRKDFEKQYPQAKCEDIASEWLSDDKVRIADFYYKHYEKKTLVEYEIDGLTGTVKGVAMKDDVPFGAREIKTRETKVCTVKYAKISGGDILEEGSFPSSYIPIVPVYGLEVFLKGKRSFFSLIHQAKDPQRMLNFWKSASTEVLALQPKAPWLGAVGQFETYKKQWETANTENFPFLEYDMVVDPTTGTPAPPPQRQQPPVASSGMMQEASMSVEAIKGSLGMYDASLGGLQEMNDVSGKALIRQQMQGDNATFHFVDNLSIAIRHVGRILVDMIPRVYTTARIIRILGEDGAERMVPINQPVVMEGKEYRKADSTKSDLFIDFEGKYDVNVEVGQSYATRRQEAANAVMELMRIHPAFGDIAADVLVQNLDIPNAEELAKRIRATMAPELLGEDAEAARLQQVTAAMAELQKKLELTEQALLAKRDNEEFKNNLEMRKIENDTLDLQIKAAKTEAEIAKMQAETSGVNVETMQALIAEIADLRAKTDDATSALDLLLSDEEEATGVPETPAMGEPVTS